MVCFFYFRDRCRTCVNVWGDATGAGVVQQICGKALGISNTEEEKETEKETTISEENVVSETTPIIKK